MNRTASALLLSVSLALAPVVVNAADATPDATIHISGNNVALGVGYSTANGTLTFQGESYPVRVQALGGDDIAAARMAATGEVYNLAQLDDLNGDYAPVSKDAASPDNGHENAVQNQKGVVIELHATSEGRHLNLAGDGFSVRLAR